MADRTNVVILTIGRAGSTVLARMLAALGWSLPDADEYAEPVGLREVNERLLRGLHVDDEELLAVLGEFREPWVVKDPRFCWTLRRWRPLLVDRGSLLVWLTRDLASIEQSLRRAGWGRETPAGYTLRGVPLPTIEQWCQRHYEQWTGPKVHARYEDLRAAVSLFDIGRGFDTPRPPAA